MTTAINVRCRRSDRLMPVTTEIKTCGFAVLIVGWSTLPEGIR